MLFNMKADTEQSFESICGSSDVVKDHIHRIKAHLVPRGFAHKWANQLHFIAMHESGEEDTVSNTSTSQSQNSDGDQDLLVLDGNDNLNEVVVSEAISCASSDEGLHCKCLETPFFEEGRISSYVVKQIESPELEGCTHYLAVSYCWKQQPISDQAYSVITGDVARHNHAPREVLDRAISFATCNGIRLVWIDQECIQKDNREDQEFGIQSMDLVYQRAASSVALFNVCIEKQTHLNALFKAFNHDELTGYNELVEAIEVLELILNDKWTSRAWCFQEASSAGESMYILVRREKNLVTEDEYGKGIWLRIEGEIQFTVSELHCAATAIATWWDELSAEFGGRGDLDLSGRINVICDKIYTIAGGAFQDDPEGRYSCNAAQAVALMITRQNSRLPDRLAIMANLCNYKIRLNTQSLEDEEKVSGQHFSFSICAYTLAIINGDMSLLFGSKMRAENIIAEVTSNLRIPPSSSFSWLPDMNATLHNTPYPEETGRQYLLENPEISDSGFCLTGYLWKVEYQLKLSNIPSDFAMHWREEVSRPGWIYTNKPLIKLAKEFFSAILHELRSEGLSVLADILWYNAGIGALKPSSSQDITSHSQGQCILLENWTDSVFAPTGLRWIMEQWIQTGSLWCGQQFVGTTRSTNELCCIFDCKRPGFVLTPYAGEQVESTPSIKARGDPISWIVEPSGSMSGGIEKLVCRDMVRGIWNGTEIIPKRYLLD